MILYHGTSRASAAGILRRGLSAGQLLTPSLEIADIYAKRAGGIGGESTGVVMRSEQLTLGVHVKPIRDTGNYGITYEALRPISLQPFRATNVGDSEAERQWYSEAGAFRHVVAEQRRREDRLLGRSV